MATPQLAVVNALYLNIQGLQLSNDATTPNTILDVSPGQCRDSTNSNDIYLPSTKVILGGSTLVQPPFINQTVANPITVNTAINGAGGLDVGAIAASTLYYVYAIGSSVAQIGAGQPISIYPGNAMISLSATQPVLPFGYDMFRRIGTMLTNGASQIAPFAQIGSGNSRTIKYGTPIATGAAASALTANNVTVGVNTNPGVSSSSTQIHFSASITPTAAGSGFILSTGPAGGTVGNYAEMTGDVAGLAHVAPISCPCNAAQQVFYRELIGGGTLTLLIQGFDDQL